MTRGAPPARRALPSAVMMWTVNDPVIEDGALLRTQFEDIAAAGFRGITAMVRCSHYSWVDAPARRALAEIGALCRARGMAFWICADPRQSCLSLEGGKGAVIVTCCDATGTGGVPNTARARDGRFSIRCAVRPRPSHILPEGAVEFAPDGIEKVYAFLDAPAGPGAAIDITGQARFHWNAADRAVEASGLFVPPRRGAWRVLAFFRFRTNVFDFGDTDAMDRYIAAVGALAADGVAGDALLWDEPGYLCMDGAFPMTKAIRSAVKRNAGIDILDALWALAIPSADGRHIAVRNAYFREVQSTVVKAQQRARRAMRRVWGHGAIMGMHDTWRWESASVADRNHGSLDLWRGLAAKDCGFVDLGSVNLLEKPTSSFYANLAAMSAVAASLGRHSARQAAYNNLWTTGADDGTPSQYRLMEHCVNVMALFGLRWSAHLYGPAGTLGHEASFLGLPFTPGYPEHSTWRGMPAWTSLLERHHALLEGGLPRANLLFVLPVESLFAADGMAADAAFARVFTLLLRLVDRRYQPEVIAPSMLADAEFGRDRVSLHGRDYDAVVWPYGEVVPASLVPKLRGKMKGIHWVHASPVRSDDGARLPPSFRPDSVDERSLFAALARNASLRPFRAPAHAWASITPLRDGALFALAPARAGWTFEGELRFDGQRVRVPASDGVRRYVFRRSGPPCEACP